MGILHPRSDRRRNVIRRRLLVQRLNDRRVLASIAGEVFNDANHSFQRDAEELAEPSRLIYLDQNSSGSLDNGEPLVVAEPDGSFEFTNLADGTYQLRLYNGTQTQQQTFPILAQTPGDPAEITAGIDLIVGDPTYVLTGDSIVQVALETAETDNLSVGNQLTAISPLPDGTLLIVGNDTAGETAWIVDPIAQSVVPTKLNDDPSTVGWASVALDQNGTGLLLEATSGDSFVRSIDASDELLGVQVSTTDVPVPAGTTFLTSPAGPRSVIASPATPGLSLSLWSNSEGSLLPGAQTFSGATELVAFDDAATTGIAVLRTDDGGISIHDVNSNFDSLYSLEDVSGPVLIDASRDLLFSYSPLDSLLRLSNLNDGTLVADLALDLSEVGEVSALALGNSNDSIVVLGAAGILEVKLNRPAAHEITITDNVDVDAVLFGVILDGANSAPNYETQPSFETDEDTDLLEPAPASRVGSLDEDGDSYVLVQRGSASSGTAVLDINGLVDYKPDLNFHGTDFVTVLLHDGRDMSDEVMLEFTVAPVSDPLIDVDVVVNPVPENLESGEPIGDIEVVDGDGFGHQVEINDPRFDNRGDQIIFVGGELNFEDQPFIPLTITVTDLETDESIETNVTLSLTDQNDPITEIIPSETQLTENRPGDVVDEIEVVDQDADQEYEFSVDDERFIIDERDLRLVPGVAVDYETEQTIIVNVTVTEVGFDTTFTQAITIRIIDVPEQPQGLSLSNATVLELEQGAVVGEVRLDNVPAPSNYALSVNDSRFEFVDGNLKLVDDQFVERAAQEEIEVEITATDTGGQFTPVSQSFVIAVIENQTPLHNSANPYDANHQDGVTGNDVLVIINYLGTYGPGPVGEGDFAYCYDVNADGMITVLDALLVVNEINRLEDLGGSTGGEGEQISPPATPNPSQDFLPSRIASSEKANPEKANPEKASAENRDDFFVELDQAELFGEAIALVANAGANRIIAAVDLSTDSSHDDTYPDDVDQALRLLSDKA